MTETAARLRAKIRVCTRGGVVDGCRPVHVPENVIALYPGDPDLGPSPGFPAGTA